MQEQRIGEVIAVCLSDTKAFPKFPQSEVEIYEYGVWGDSHSGERRPSYSQPGVMKDNDRAVSIVADEVREETNQKLGLNIQPGGFNENILVRGLGDLSDLRGGERLVFSNGIVLKVTETNPPCRNFQTAYDNAPLISVLAGKTDGQIWNKRGVVATVEQTGILRPRVQVMIQYTPEEQIMFTLAANESA